MFRRLPFLSLAGLVWALAGTPAQSQHPNHPLGFASDRAYQGGSSEVDTVDLFSGTLSLALPIGPFSLSYNSNIWRYEVTLDGQGNQVISAQPDREMSAGLGWHLGLGQLYAPGHWYNPSTQWLYVDPTHGRHYFYDDLHRGENDGDAGVFYTRDNTYLRLKRLNNFEYDLEFPNGTVQRFANETGGPGTTYRLRKSWDPFGSATSPDLTVGYQVSGKDPNVETWELTDRWGNVQRIHTLTNQTWMNRLVTSVDVPGVGGARVLYNFVYRSVLVSVSCKDNNPATADRITIPHLERIDLPDGTSYKMTDAANALTYYNVCESGIEDVPGVLKGLQLPTGGRIAWTFQEYEFPPGGTNSPFYTSAGVATRTLQKGDGTALGTWRYRTVDIAATETEDPEVWLDLVFPTGDCARHFFNARYWQTPSQGRGWEYGLPFSYKEQSVGKYLSNQVWTSNDGAGGCSGTKLRSTYLRFRRDVTPGTGTVPASDWYNTNRMPEASRVVFHDDANRWIDTESSEFDGLGHFRFTTTTGNLFDDPVNQERRTARVNFDKVAGTYPGSFVPPATTALWLLGTASSAETSEPGARGQTVAKVELGYDTLTGAVQCERVITSGTTRTSHDILRLYTRDSRGRVTQERVWGGDLQTLPTSGSLCTAPAFAPEQWVQHEYVGAHHARTRPIQPNGVAGSFLSYDVTPDPSTGLALTSRNEAGLQTTFVYDALGRTSEIRPPAGAKTTFHHQVPTALAGGCLEIRKVSSSGATLASREIFYDLFGRAERQRETLANSVVRDDVTEFNVRGWVVARSIPGFPAKKTEYQNFDAFGRARRLRSPEGASHDVTYTYQGLRRVVVGYSTATAPSSESVVSRTHEFDSRGRLRAVYEESLSGVQVPTRLEYDVAGRLTRTLSGTSPTVQERVFSYDNRGILTAEQHPELGVAGNGSVVYPSHNSRGQVLRLQDGRRDLSFTYDFLGRRTAVRDETQGGRLVSEFSYDGPNGFGKGKPWTAIQHNYVDLPWTGVGVDDVQIRDLFLYDASGSGKMTRHQVQVSWGSTALPFTELFAYGDFGEVTTHTLFQCLAAPCAGTIAGSAPTREYSYSNGELVGITGFVSSITYHPSGQWQEIVHSTGARDRRTLDPVNPARVLRAETLDTGGATMYDSGTLSYDGLGYPMVVDGRTLVYDKAGRLKQEYWSANQRRDYSYDAFGNLLSRTDVEGSGRGVTTDFGIQSATNRIAGGTYDASGNLRALGDFTYDYNTDNRLVAFGVGRYLYNAFGERAAELYINSGSDGLRFFLRNPGSRLTTEMTYTAATGAIARLWDYTWAGGQLVARSGPTGFTEHYHFDSQGNVRLVTDGGVVPRKEMSFGPYGNDLLGNALGNRFAFAGHELDQLGRLYSMHARHYDATRGRFLALDSLSGDAALPQSLNRYSYADANPMAFRDPDGRSEEGITLGESRRLSEALHEGIAFGRCGTDESCQLMSQVVTRFYGSRSEIGWDTYQVGKAAPFVLSGPKVAGGFAVGAVNEIAAEKGETTWNGIISRGAMAGALSGALEDTFKGSVVAGLDQPIGNVLQGWIKSSLDWLDKVLGDVLPGGDFGGVTIIYDYKFGHYEVYEKATGRLITTIVDVEAKETQTDKPENVSRIEVPTRNSYRGSDDYERSRGNAGILALMGGRCMIDPLTCSLWGGAGAGGTTVTVQFY